VYVCLSQARKKAFFREEILEDTSTLYPGVGLRISPENQSEVGRIIEVTLEEGRGKIFGSREIFSEGSEGSEGSGVTNDS
jgi:hypothetical protein